MMSPFSCSRLTRVFTSHIAFRYGTLGQLRREAVAKSVTPARVVEAASPASASPSHWTIRECWSSSIRPMCRSRSGQSTPAVERRLRTDDPRELGQPFRRLRRDRRPRRCRYPTARRSIASCVARAASSTWMNDHTPAPVPTSGNLRRRIRSDDLAIGRDGCPRAVEAAVPQRRPVETGGQDNALEPSESHRASSSSGAADRLSSGSASLLMRPP